MYCFLFIVQLRLFLLSYLRKGGATECDLKRNDQTYKPYQQYVNNGDASQKKKKLGTLQEKCSFVEGKGIANAFYIFGTVFWRYKKRYTCVRLTTPRDLTDFDTRVSHN